MKNSSFISILILLCLFNHNNSYAGDKKPEGGKRIVGVEVQSKVGVYGGTACYFGEKAMVLQKVGRNECKRLPRGDLHHRRLRWFGGATG